MNRSVLIKLVNETVCMWIFTHLLPSPKKRTHSNQAFQKFTLRSLARQMRMCGPLLSYTAMRGATMSRFPMRMPISEMKHVSIRPRNGSPFFVVARNGDSMGMMLSRAMAFNRRGAPVERSQCTLHCHPLPAPMSVTTPEQRTSAVNLWMVHLLVRLWRAAPIVEAKAPTSTT